MNQSKEEVAMTDNPERERLQQHRIRKANWHLWGPYLSDRAWGTVREDYSADGEAWEYFTHDMSRSRAYRWNEDGLGGISDRNQYLCFALAFWNGKDPILKERYFGLSNKEGNHGEDVKECYYHIDNTPTHSYMKMLYKYPQQEYPYLKLLQESRKRTTRDKEFNLSDTGIFDNNQYFDIFIEYAKAGQSDILIKITAHNRAQEAAPLHILPTLWFRNTWDWGYPAGPMKDVPTTPYMNVKASVGNKVSAIRAQHCVAGDYFIYAEEPSQALFTNNSTNNEKLFKTPNTTPFVKDAFHRYIINKEKHAVNGIREGTKGAYHYEKTIPGGGSCCIKLRLTNQQNARPFDDFDETFALRQKEADIFYDQLQSKKISPTETDIQRKAFAGLLWTKQFYYYDVDQWCRGDPAGPCRRKVPLERNVDWNHLINFDVISMPDKWEFPWYASWDLAFHCVSLVLVDPDFAKRQITLMTREWYMHPNGQLPAYEWCFGDTNPPVLAWAAWRVYKIDAHINGSLDVEFLSGIFHKLLLNFTWWVNKKDSGGRNVFQGGFLGLDNISIFNRSDPLPSGGHVVQSDATAWMAFFCIIMIKIAIEISRDRPVYQDMATKFFEHFLRIGGAMINCGGQGYSLWDEQDGFFYDVIARPDGSITPLKVRSLVGLLPLLGVETANQEFFSLYPLFTQRVRWFLQHHPEFMQNLAPVEVQGDTEKRLLAILTRERLLSVLRYMLDENEFLSPHGIRSVSKYHEKNPYKIDIGGKTYTIQYEPAESQSLLFGGNSNWRGPIWFPLNFLIIESLQKFHYYYGDNLKVECPTGSGNYMTLWEVATDISRRLIGLFLPNEKGERPIFSDNPRYAQDPHWRDLILFNEYFDGNTGLGLGASHQTGWTGLIAKLIQQSGRPMERTWLKDSESYRNKVRD